jgi:tRNA(Ile)-lysidine synthase
MHQRVKAFIEKHQLLPSKGTLLVAVSGGVDSMVLLDLMQQIGVDVAVAHCNFLLRGKESDGDEQLVKDYCQLKNIGFHLARINTRQYAEEHKISIQEAARELRYEWFRKLVTEYGYSAVATAHHATDQVETMLLQMLRGTGIRGLQGMLPENHLIIRPLLEITRKEIVDYARQYKIVFREDSSNTSDKYSRNLLRKEVLPVLEKINPAFEQHFVQTSMVVQQLNGWLESEVEKWAKKHLLSTSRSVKIPLKPLLKHKASQVLLFELLQPFGFSSATITQVYKALQEQSGKLFFSHTHRLIKDREELIISRFAASDKSGVFFITTKNDELTTPEFTITINHIPKPDNLFVNPGTALLDSDLVKFPLVVRQWQPGDKFKPLGMKGWKKVSDFLTDLKLSIADKERVWVMESDGEIIWIAGWRIDNRYKITKKTKRVIQMNWTPVE